MSSRPRGRPRKFDEQAVLRQARQLFLEKGFEAAPYEKIAEAVGLSKPSLYNAFGDKAALFERVLAEYAAEGLTHLTARFADADTLGDGTHNFLQMAAVFYARPGGHSIGCLLAGTALPACAHTETVRDTLATFIKDLEKRLEQIIASQYAQDAARLGKAPKMLAMQIVNLHLGLAVRARTGLSAQKLKALARELSQSVR